MRMGEDPHIGFSEYLFCFQTFYGLSNAALPLVANRYQDYANAAIPVRPNTHAVISVVFIFQ